MQNQCKNLDSFSLKVSAYGRWCGQCFFTSHLQFKVLLNLTGTTYGIARLAVHKAFCLKAKSNAAYVMKNGAAIMKFYW